MFSTLIYSHPPWLVTCAFILLGLSFASLSMLVIYRTVKRGVRDNHNELTSFTVTNIGVLYAVLLAFIAVATWEAFTRAVETVETEADLANNLYRDTRGCDAAVAAELQRGIRDYLTVVIQKEWPAQQEGVVPTAGWSELELVHSRIASLAPKTMGEGVLMQEMLRTLNQLYSARMSRLNAVRGHIPYMVWWVIVLVGAVNIVYSCLLAAEGSAMHFMMLAGLTATLTLVIALIVQLDYPFRGTISVTPEAFARVLEETGQSAQLERSRPLASNSRHSHGGHEPSRRPGFSSTVSRLSDIDMN
jgi:ABC-type multidrug transport system fused ATPase/permease subunit